MQNIVAKRFGGIDETSKAADAIGEKFGARRIGSGVFVPTNERDIQWHIPDEKAPMMAAMLRKQGWRVEVTALESA